MLLIESIYTKLLTHPIIERAYLSGKSYVTLALTGDSNVDKALTRKLDEDGYKVALNDDNIMVSWGF